MSVDYESASVEVDAGWSTVELPGPVTAFINAFDEHAYPDLVEVDDEDGVAA